MGRGTRFWLVLALTAGVAACDNDDPVRNRTGGGGGGGTGPKTQYDLAGGCFALRAAGNYVKNVNGALTAAADAAGDPERFFMHATGLGRYAFFTSTSRFVTGGSGGSVSLAAAPSDGADWTFDPTNNGIYKAGVAAGKLAVSDNGSLTLTAQGADLGFEAVTGCAAYPEMPVNVGETYTGPETGELIGYADIHAHMAMGSDMSDGSGDRGPSAGGVMYGHAVNRFGASEALKDCSVIHGPEGSTTAEIVLDAGPDPHDTVGWPTFIDWPARDSQLHQQMYWKWVERSWRAGQRLMVIHGTNIEALCDVAKKASTGEKDTDCTDMGVGMKQVAYVHDMQDYIDAQNGGPGKGWFRVVKSPTEAEAVIRAGKMAVVPGLEFSNIFECNVTYVLNGGEVVGCSKDTIDAQIEEVWDAGVRGIFLYHDVDSALGGAGIFSNVLNLVNYYGTKGWWQTYTCDSEWNGEDDKGYFYGAGAVMPGANEYAPLLANPIGAALIEGAAGVFPVYPPGRQCNARGTGTTGITELGRYALEAVMKKGFVLDIDHAEIRAKQTMLDVGAQTTPAYPMISAHGGHGGFTNAQVEQMLRQGGIMYPGMVNGPEYINFVNKVEARWNTLSDAQKAAYPLAVGYGADQNGLANQPGPRGNGKTVDYANGFKLFDGTLPGWSARLAALPDVPVAQLKIEVAGGRSWNVDEEGIANYGMLPDMVEQIRQESGGNAKYLDSFYRSADAYVRLWKQTLAASAVRPAPVPPANPPPHVPHPLDPTTGETPVP
jgi:hypothetical protein